MAKKCQYNQVILTDILSSKILVVSFAFCSVGQEDGLKSARYYPINRNYGPHFDMEDVADFHDNPTDTGEADEEYEFLMKENADKKESRSEHTTQLHETQRYLKNF